MRCLFILFSFTTLILTLGSIPNTPQTANTRPGDENNKPQVKIGTSRVNNNQPVRTTRNIQEPLHQRPNQNTNHQFHSHSTASHSSSPSQSPPMNPLLKRVSTASLCLIYFILAWRALGSYELSGLFVNGIFRFLCTVSVSIVFISNCIALILCLAGNVLKPIDVKNQLKFVLALNTIKESVELVYNILMMVLASSGAEFSKDFYLGRFITSLYFLMLCLSTSKIRWTAAPPSSFAPPPTSTSAANPYQNYDQSYDGQSSSPVYESTSYNYDQGEVEPEQGPF